MKDENRDFAGKSGFVWWIGVIEDRQDPLKMGRCRIRCVGWHSDNKMELPTKDLPWAIPCYPPNNSNTYAPKEGDMVFGFFADGENGQSPIFLGVFPSIPLVPPNSQQAFNDPRTTTELNDSPVKPYESKINYPRKLDEPTTSRLARNDSDYPSEIIQSKKDKKLDKVEPDSYYAAKYPYNNVIETESGHAIELDDTPNSERVHIYHRSGSYVEWAANGDRTERIQKDKFTVVVGDEKVYIQGDVTVYVDGNVNMDIGGNFQADIGGTCKITSGGNMTLTAPRIDLNP